MEQHSLETSEAWARFTGLTLEQAMDGRSVEQFVNEIPADYRECFDEAIPERTYMLLVKYVREAHPDEF